MTEKTQIDIIAGAEEFELGEGPIGALLIHGYTGSPQGLRGLGEHLADRGVAVMAPRLPGHGTTWQDLNTRRPEEWVHHVEEAFTRMAAEREQVFLVALSFGAALALNLAAHYPDRIAGIVTLAGWVHTKDPRRFLAPVIRKVTASLPGAGNDIADPSQREIVYDRLPTSSTYYTLKFLKHVKANLGAVRSPILVIHSRNDHTVHPSNADAIINGVSSEDKELVWLDDSYHVITLDHDREKVFTKTFEFIRSRSAAAE
ncbi:MAG TPA: alpha/beta fold hydrolase [Actinomycetota bacterium]|nr:alpha/beta fold hydrolase [Actinomycetota bacterium]